MNEAQRSECRVERLVKPLVLHLKREYWEAIRDGTKLEEYRERGPYWGRRLRNKEFSEVVLLLGYPKAGDESRTLRRKWKGYQETNITHPLFGERVPVFSIDVSERLNAELTETPKGRAPARDGRGSVERVVRRAAGPENPK